MRSLTPRIIVGLLVAVAAVVLPASALAAKAVKPTYSFSKGAFSGTEPANNQVVPQQNQVGITRNPNGIGSVQVSTLATGGNATAGADCTTAGVDYIAIDHQTVNFTKNNAQSFFSLQVCPDAIYEGPETVALQLSNPSVDTGLGSKSLVTFTIGDNDAAPKLTIDGDTTPEGSQLLFTVHLTGSAQRPTTVNFASSDGPAAAPRIAALVGEDYTAKSGTLTFAGGGTTGTSQPDQQFRVDT